MALATESINLAEILSQAYELAELIESSQEMHRYIQAKRLLATDREAQEQIAAFQKLKERHEEVQRFGKYHPDFYQVSRDVRVMKKELDRIPSVQNFKKAEETLEELLYEVSKTIASAVSDTIKVPGNHPFEQLGGCGGRGCGTGGCGCS